MFGSAATSSTHRRLFSISCSINNYYGVRITTVSQFYDIVDLIVGLAISAFGGLILVRPPREGIAETAEEEDASDNWVDVIVILIRVLGVMSLPFGVAVLFSRV